MRARFATIPFVALVSAAVAGSVAAASATAPVRLVDIRPQVEPGRSAVLIEASGPMAYAASQPDPLTVLVDLREVEPGGATNHFTSMPVGPIGSVSIERRQAADGVVAARVRVDLTVPTAPKVRSRRNRLLLEFGEGADASAVEVLGAVSATAPPAAAEPGAATELSSVAADATGDAVRVTLRGNGRLDPLTVEEVRDLPPRLMLDLPGVVAAVPRVTKVGHHGVERIRVGEHSKTPLVTRVVVDLDHRQAYRVERSGEGGQDLVLVVGGAPADQGGAPVTGAVAKAAAAPKKSANTPASTSTSAAASKPDALKSDAPRADVATPDVAKPETSNVEPAPAAAPRSETAKVEAPTPAPVAPLAPKVDPPRPAPPKPAADAATPSAAPATPARTAVRRAAPGANAAAAPPETTPEVVQAPVNPTALASSAPGNGRDSERRFVGHPVSLDFQGVDLRAVLRTFAEISNLNIVIDPAVTGNVDVSLRDVPWDQALDIILRANQLGYSVDGNIVRVAPLTRLRQEEDEKRKLAEARALSGEMEIATRSLNYAKAGQIEPLLKNVLSTRGRTAIDPRTNTIIINDLPIYVAHATELIQNLDEPELQVEIEARIIQTTKKFARELGLKWNFFGNVAPELGNTTGLAFPNNGSLGAGVNVPTVNTPTGAARLLLGSVNGAFNVDVQLQALEKENKIRTLLSPRVVTQNNVKATITRGQEIPYTTTVATPPSGAGQQYITPIPTVQFKTAALSLNVTPHITAANTVVLEVDVDNGSPGDVQPNGNVAINTQRAVTTVLVLDGATTVIGGIQSQDERMGQDRVPGLARLPLLGSLFKNNLQSTIDDEILVFITPRIIRTK